MRPRQPFDHAAYAQRTHAGPCFICAVATGDPPELRDANEMIYEDDDVLVFLNRYPTLLGYTLVCPRRHVERVVGDLSEDAYVALQRWIYRVGRAIEQVVETERLYVCSLGSQQGNRHIHWHIAPLPRGVPYAEQQLEALDLRKGIIEVSHEEQVDLARRIRERLLA